MRGRLTRGCRTPIRQGRGVPTRRTRFLQRMGASGGVPEPNMTPEELTSGEDVKVDYASIEQTLAELWRVEKKDHDNAVTRAALWNVVAHSATPEHHTQASEVLGKASIV